MKGNNMKLSKTELCFIENAARTALLFKIDKLIIDEHGCRGIDECRTVYLNQDNAHVPALSFKSMCILRVPVFISRLNIAQSQEDVEAHITTSDSGWVQSITFKSRGTKIEYRGSDPTTHTVYKSLNDEVATAITLTETGVDLMKRGIVAMGATQIKIISNDVVSFEITDINNDVLSYEFPDNATSLSSNYNTKFAYKYPANLLLSLVKQDATGCVTVGGRIGTLSMKINDINVYIIPQK